MNLEPEAEKEIIRKVRVKVPIDAASPETTQIRKSGGKSGLAPQISGFEFATGHFGWYFLPRNKQIPIPVLSILARRIMSFEQIVGH